MGESDVAGLSGYGATAQSIGSTSGAVASLVNIADSGINGACSDIYIGAQSSQAFMINHGNFSSSGGYLSFSIGSTGAFLDTGLIFEFDLYVGLDASGNANIPATYKNSSGKTITGSINFGMLTSSGASTAPHKYQAIKISAGKQGYWTLGGSAFRADQWQHITIQYVPSTQEGIAAGNYDGVYNVYVGDDNSGRKLVMSFSSYGSSNPNAGVTVSGEVEPNVWRLTYTGQASSGNRIYLDNVLFYKGTKIHDPFVAHKLDKGYTLVLNSVSNDLIGAGYRIRSYEYIKGNKKNPFTYEHDYLVQKVLYEICGGVPCGDWQHKN
jgi:hypothetical protein